LEDVPCEEFEGEAMSVDRIEEPWVYLLVVLDDAEDVTTVRVKKDLLLERLQVEIQGLTNVFPISVTLKKKGSEAVDFFVNQFDQ